MDKETMEFLKTMQESITNQISDLKIDVNERFNAVDERFDAVDKRFNAVDKRLDNLEESFKAHEVETMERFTEVLNFVKDSKFELKKDIKELRDYMEGIAEIQGRHEADIKFLKKQVM